MCEYRWLHLGALSRLGLSRVIVLEHCPCMVEEVWPGPFAWRPAETPSLICLIGLTDEVEKQS